MATNKAINFKSDFSAILGIEGGWGVPFKAKFWAATPSRSFTASWDGATYTNCQLLQDGRLMIAFDNHNLGTGALMLELTFYLTNQDYQDGICNEAIPQFQPTFKDAQNNEYHVILDYSGSSTLQTIGTLPAYYQKGEKGDKGEPGNVKFSDLTDEQRASLKGEKGDKGDRGLTGPQGVQGATGAKGDKGDKGDTGAKGEKGDKFTSNDFTEEEWASLKGDKGEKGDNGANGAPFTYDMFTDDQLAGLKGPKGDNGEDGAKGEDGAQGPQGEKGDTGDAMTFDQLTPSQKAELKGEKGDKGDQGIQGIQGEKGATGDKGAKGDKGDPSSPTVKYAISGAITDNTIYELTPATESFTIPTAPTDNKFGVILKVTPSADITSLTIPDNSIWVNEPSGTLTSGKTFLITIIDGIYDFVDTITHTNSSN